MNMKTFASLDVMGNQFQFWGGQTCFALLVSWRRHSFTIATFVGNQLFFVAPVVVLRALTTTTRIMGYFEVSRIFWQSIPMQGIEPPKAWYQLTFNQFYICTEWLFVKQLFCSSHRNGCAHYKRVITVFGLESQQSTQIRTWDGLARGMNAVAALFNYSFLTLPP